MQTKTPPETIRRAADILKLLSYQGRLGIREVSRYLEEDKSAVQRAMQALEMAEFVARDAETGKWTVSPQLLELGRRASDNLNLIERASPYLLSLHGKIKEIVFLSIPVDADMLHIDAMPVRSAQANNGEVQIASRIGYRVPMHCTAVGMAYLAELSLPERQQLYQHMVFSRVTDISTTSQADLEARLAAVRQRGYALADEEFRLGFAGVAAAIVDTPGHPVATISIVGVRARLVGERTDLVGALVRRAAADLSRLLRD